MKNSHSKYVIAPIDKATGNVSFVCKRFYAKVLIDELGLNIGDHTNISDTYIRETNKDIPSIVNNHLSDLANKFSLDDFEENNKCLPQIYWLPKMHKQPIKARFIVAAPKCSVKMLSKAITKVFKLFYQQIESYNKKSTFSLE